MLYNTQDVAELIGINYKRLWYAIATGKIQESQRVGTVRLFDDADVAEIKAYFQRRSGRTSDDVQQQQM